MYTVLPTTNMIGQVGKPSFLPVSGTSMVGGLVAKGIITSNGAESFLSSCLGVDGLLFCGGVVFFCGGGAVNGLAFSVTAIKQIKNVIKNKVF